MRTSLKLAAFGGGLVLAFGAALGVGAAVGSPVTSNGSEDHAHETAGSVSASGLGLKVADSGYRLQLATTETTAGKQDLRFTVVTADGPLITYERSHDEDLHLIVVRRDLTGFQHVHPTLGSNGTWSSPVDLTAGTWRVFTDFVPGSGEAEGTTITLGADLHVGGTFTPVALPEPSTTARVDGYVVTLTGRLVAGEESALTLTFSKAGQPLTDLQPYLAAYGHLVALRAGDLAYLHAHPLDDTAAGPTIVFSTTVPSTGTYRLFLDFRHGDTVRTAELTVVAHAAGTTGHDAATPNADAHDADGHEHGPGEGHS